MGDRGRRVLIGAALLLLGLHLAFSLRPALFTIRNDFANYYVSARIVASGGSLDRVYERDWFQNEVRRAGIDRLGGFTSYPPANALLLVPLARLSPLMAKAAWTALLAAALLAAFLVLRSVAPLSPWLLALVFLLPSSSLSNALLFGQPYPLLLLLLCLSLAALLRGRPLLAGFLLAPIVVLKVYGIPYFLYFVWTRRSRAAAGFVAGVAALTAAAVGVLGWRAHATYLREVLPPCLKGELLDPYATVWQTVPGVAHRLFQYEPDLNPHPAVDLPALATGLSRGLPVALLVAAVLAASASRDAGAVRRDWAVLSLASLAASPVVASYHFLFLVLPVSLILEGASPRRAASLLALLAFAASPAPFAFARFASGWGNLFACPRLYAVLALFGVAVRPGLSVLRCAVALAAGLAARLAAVPASAAEPWTRVAEAHGYLAAEPVACEGGLAWVGIDGEHLVVRTADSRLLQGAGDTFGPRCVAGRLAVQRSVSPGATGEPADVQDADTSADGRVTVVADREAGAIRERRSAMSPGRILAKGLVRYPRLSPDGAWVAYQSWSGGSWNIDAVERATGRIVRVTADPANEMEPAWMGADRLVFASDRGRGLGLAALYTVPFTP